LVNNGGRGVAAFGAGSTFIALLVNNSVSAFNAGDGVLAQGTSGLADVTVKNSSIFENGGNGLFVDGSFATMRVTKSTINLNGIEVTNDNFLAANGGTLISFGDNSLDHTGQDGVATVTVPLK